MRTLTGTYAYGFSPNGLFGDDPLTVASTGSISSVADGIALDCQSPFKNFAFYWDVTNYGRITAQGTRSSGVVLEDGGKLVNGASAATGAYISGGSRGISMPNGGGAVVNYGTIAATAANSVAVDLPVGGQVKNFGLVAGPNISIEIGTVAGTVTNSGTIGQAGANAGVLLAEGGTVVNGSSSAKNALIAGIEAFGGPTAISNYASISAFGIFLDDGGSVANSGGVAGAEFGIDIYGTGTVTNHGTIRGNGSAGNSDADGVFFTGTAGADFVSNIGNGYIAGNRFGIYASGGSATVVNTARIENGIVLEGIGTVTNGRSGSRGGHIAGTALGIYLRQGGTVFNYGTVSAASANGEGVGVGGAGGLVTNFGLIEGELGASANGTAATVANYGTVRGIASSPGEAVYLGAGSRLTNGARGYIGAAYGLGVLAGEPGATVANTGTIADGIFLQAGGNVTNGQNGSTGALITGVEGFDISKIIGYQAIEVSGAAGTVTNYGTIDGGTGVGVRLLNGGFVRNAQASALIIGSESGVSLGGLGAVVNRGTISASDAIGIGVSLKNSFDHTVTNSGTITGAGGTAVAFGAGDDRLIVGSGARFNGIVLGGGGTNEVDFNKTGRVSLAPEYVGFSIVRLSKGAADTLTVTAADFAGISSNTVSVYGGNSGNTITAALPPADKLVLHGGAGKDTFNLSLPSLASAKVTGGAGTDTLDLTDAGAVAAGGVSGVERIFLSSAGRNVLTLSSANFGGVIGKTITVSGGNAGNTITAVPPAGDKVVLDGGTGNDTFRLSPATLASATVSGGLGADALVVTGPGTVLAGGVSGVETYRLASGARNILTLTDLNFTNVANRAITVTGGDADNIVSTATLAGTNRVVFVGGAGKDLFTGGAGNDTFELTATNLGSTDRLRGAGGSDRLVLLSSGMISAAGVFAGIETIVLSSAGKNTLALNDGNFGGVTGRTITVIGGNAGNKITAILPAADKVVLQGGSGSDTFDLSPATLAGATISGGLGADAAVLTDPGTVAAGRVSGIETYRLANGGADNLTLTSANFAGVSGSAITVTGGNAGNRISEASVAAADLVTMKGGVGADTLIAGRHAVMTGGTGADFFVFETPGSSASADRNRITDFASKSDRLAFSDAGFRLGLAKASAIPQRLPAGLFSTRTNGSFDKTGERFAYDKSTGALYFDADGSGASHQRQLVATLANHATIGASNLFFVS